MNKKIIKSLCIVAIAALAAGGTYSYFQDTETSVGNKFVAGKLNLKIDNTCHYNGKICSKVGEIYLWEGTEEQCFCSWEVKDLNGELFFNLNDVKPGDFGEDTISLHVDNNDAWLCAEVANLKNNDNNCETPELKDEVLAYGAGNETCGNPGLGQGELQSKILFTIWKDNGAGANACNNILDDDETASVIDQPAQAGIWPIADSGDNGAPIGGGSTVCYGVKWNLPLATNNIIQTDSLEGDLKISAIQARHMENFLCSSLSGNEAICGDGIMNGAEQCDDGNTVNGDGCSAACQIENPVCNNGSAQACYSGPSGTLGVGICQAGSQICSNNVWGSCVGEVLPALEVCDALDNNCDGQVDEGLGMTICGVGACQNSVNNCTGGVLNSCTPGTPTVETCDNLDNNCNGTIDEGNPSGGASCSTGLLGLCAAGTTQCQIGGLMCVQNVLPAAETCNGLDDDCNGAIDEAMGTTTCGVGACQNTVNNCTGGVINICTPNSPSAEICDGIDNNCNGAVDDNCN